MSQSPKFTPSLSLPQHLERAQGLLILAALFATPLLMTTLTYEQFVWPKVAWATLLAAGLALLTLAKMLCGGTGRVAFHFVNLGMALFFGWYLLLWPLAKSPSLAADRIAWLLPVLLISLFWQEWAGQKRRNLLLGVWCLAGVAGLTALWVIWQDIQVKWGAYLPSWVMGARAQNRLGDWRGMITAGFGNTDFIAMFLGTAYLPTWLLMQFTRGKVRVALLQLALCLMAAALIICWSVGNNAALILAALILAVGFGRGRWSVLWRKRKDRLAVWALLAGLAIAWLVLDTPLNPHGAQYRLASVLAPQTEAPKLPGIFNEAFSSERWKEGAPTRWVIWLNGMEMVRQHKILGVGPGNFCYVYPSMRTGFLPNDPNYLRYQGFYTNAAHNELLQTWAELGPVGAFLLLAMIFYAFRAMTRVVQASKREEKNPPHFVRLDGWIAWGGIGALTVLCGAGMMSFPLQLPSSTLLFFALLPLGEMLGEPERDEDGYRMPPLVLEGEWATHTLYLRGMSRVVGVGTSLQLPRAFSGAALTLGLLIFCGWGWSAIRPMRADVHYHKGRQLEQVGNKTEAEKEFLTALAIYPNHHDCRSHYTDFLLNQKRYADCLPQLQKVFERLNTCELYARRATIWEALGNFDKAARDAQTYRKMVPGTGGNSQ